MDNKNNNKKWQVEEGAVENTKQASRETHNEKKGAKAESSDMDEEGHRKAHKNDNCGCK